MGNVIRINFNMRTRIGMRMWPVALNEPEGLSSVSELFKCMSSAFCAALYKLSTGTSASRGPSATVGLLVVSHCKLDCRCILFIRNEIAKTF